MSWDLGEYERTADRLLPAAEVAVGALGLQAGERVLDVACGTGNASLVASRAGASAVGADLAERLVGVARTRVPAGEFVVADATALPFADGSFDAAVSVFGVIFCDGPSAARELLRVVRPGGRIVVTTWISEGPTPRTIAAIREALGGPEPPVVWSDPDVVRGLFAPHPVSTEVESIAFTAASPAAYVAEQDEHHPMWVGVKEPLRRAGKLDEVRAAIERIHAEANEDPAAFRTTSRYHVHRVDKTA